MLWLYLRRRRWKKGRGWKILSSSKPAKQQQQSKKAAAPAAAAATAAETSSSRNEQQQKRAAAAETSRSSRNEQEQQKRAAAAETSSSSSSSTCSPTISSAKNTLQDSFKNRKTMHFGTFSLLAGSFSWAHAKVGATMDFSIKTATTNLQVVGSASQSCFSKMLHDAIFKTIGQDPKSWAALRPVHQCPDQICFQSMAMRAEHDN